MEIYFAEEVWVEGGGSGSKEIVFYQNDGSVGPVSWSGNFRFALEGNDENNEAIALIPQDIWDKMMTETFYIDIEATDPQVRITDGWWIANWTDDIQPGSEYLTDNGDGTFTIAVTLSTNPDFVAGLIQKHLLITGDRFSLLKLYFK